MVGKTGFEPATPWSQTKCSAKLSYFPISKYYLNGAPERSRTPNLLIRSQTLYPIELRAPIYIGVHLSFIIKDNNYGAVERSRTSTGSPPLGPQPSASAIPPRPQYGAGEGSRTPTPEGTRS